jgi:hypothetical protein
MPKDEWRRARDQTVARKVKFELATGKALSYEFVSDEIRPLDKINVLTHHARETDQTGVAPPRAKGNPAPTPLASPRTGSRPSVRIQIASGVSVFVQLDPNSRMTVVQALEAALADAKARSELMARPKSDQAKSDRAEKEHRTKPPASTDHNETEVAELRKKLCDLAETIVAQKAVGAKWSNKPYRSWKQRLKDVWGRPSNFAPLMLELESRVFDRSPLRDPWKARHKAWRNECSSVKTFREAAKLLDEFGEPFQKT